MSDSATHGLEPTRLLRQFSRQEYWSGLPFPSPGDLPHPGIEPRSPTLQADALTSASAEDVTREAPTIVWPQVNSREGTQLYSSVENWIKDLLSMAPPNRTRPCFPLSQSLPSGSFHKPLILLHQRAAAAAKSLQSSCQTLCNPIDGSPLGSSVPGILQAKILE